MAGLWDENQPVSITKYYKNFAKFRPIKINASGISIN